MTELSVRSHPAVTRTVAWLRDIGQRLIAVRVVESSIVLAAQAFLALFPLVIVLTAVMPSGASDGLVNELKSKYGLSGLTDSAAQTLLAQRSAVQQSLSAFSFLLVLGSATAFTRALQRVYQNAWGLEKLGLRGLWRGFAWLVGLIAYLSLLGAIAHWIKHGGVVQPIAAVLGFVLWWWTPFLLLGGRVRARALLPAAVLITAAQIVAVWLSTAIMPRTVRSNEAKYGPVGVVFAVESWFVVITGTLVVCSALGAVIGRHEGRLGTWVRGTADPDGWHREVKVVQFRAPTFRHPRGETAGAAAHDMATPTADGDSGLPAGLSAQPERGRADEHADGHEAADDRSAGPPAT